MCVNTIFPNHINLLENKRLKTDEDKQTLKQFKQDIFNERIPIIRTIKKYFKFVNEITTENNIAYKNTTCQQVASYVRKLQRKKSDYEIGEVLVCRKYLKTQKQKVSFIEVVRLTEIILWSLCKICYDLCTHRAYRTAPPVPGVIV